MADTEELRDSASIHSEDNDRSQIRPSAQTSKFRVGDSVNVIHLDGTREGPYLVASIPSTGVYTLSFADGREAQEGESIEENDLEAASGFSPVRGVSWTQPCNEQLSRLPRTSHTMWLVGSTIAFVYTGEKVSRFLWLSAS